MAHASLPADMSIWSWQNAWCQPAGSRPLTPLGPTSPHSDAPGLLVSLCVTTERAGRPFLVWAQSPETQKQTESSPTPGCLRPSLPSANCPPLSGAGGVRYRTGPHPSEGHRCHGGVTLCSSGSSWFLRRGSCFPCYEASGHLGIQVTPVDFW